MAKGGVIIVGGGICGLSIGWYLARANVPVTILERGDAGHGATWSSAGMIAPQVEAEPSEERLLAMSLKSRDMWSDFSRDLEKASGIAVGYRTEGTLVVALNNDDAEELKSRYDYLRSLKLKVDWMSGPKARVLEPHLSRNATAAILSELDHQVDGRSVATALREAFLRAKGVLREHAEVSRIEVTDHQLSGVRLGDELLKAETVVVAAGAWSATIPGLPEDARPPVRPVKGQALYLQMDREHPLISHVVWAPDVYMVPRNDGRLLVGATVEEMGFDTRLTAGGILQLLRGAWDALPGTHDLPIVEMWAGLRPGSRDDAPILGPTSVKGLVLATGHHRNGILLAPMTASSISELVLTGQVPDAIKPFSLERFTKA